MKTANFAKAIILNGKGEVLLLRRSPTVKYRPGEWDFPGGVANEGEQLAITVSREVEEETGIVISVGEFTLVYAGTEAYEDIDTSINRFMFMAKTKTDDIQLSHEHDAFRWASVDAALQDFYYPFYSDGLRHAQQHGLL